MFFFLAHIIVFRFEHETKKNEKLNGIFEVEKKNRTHDKLGINREKDLVKWVVNLLLNLKKNNNEIQLFRMYECVALCDQLTKIDVIETNHDQLNTRKSRSFICKYGGLTSDYVKGMSTHKTQIIAAAAVAAATTKYDIFYFIFLLMRRTKQKQKAYQQHSRLVEK